MQCETVGIYIEQGYISIAYFTLTSVVREKLKQLLRCVVIAMSIRSYNEFPPNKSQSADL